MVEYLPKLRTKSMLATFKFRRNYGVAYVGVISNMAKAGVSETSYVAHLNKYCMH
jgi:hypothetical protein